MEKWSDNYLVIKLGNFLILFEVVLFLFQGRLLVNLVIYTTGEKWVALNFVLWLIFTEKWKRKATNEHFFPQHNIVILCDPKQFPNFLNIHILILSFYVSPFWTGSRNDKLAISVNKEYSRKGNFSFSNLVDNLYKKAAPVFSFVEYSRIISWLFLSNVFYVTDVINYASFCHHIYIIIISSESKFP